MVLVWNELAEGDTITSPDWNFFACLFTSARLCLESPLTTKIVDRAEEVDGALQFVAVRAYISTPSDGFSSFGSVSVAVKIVFLAAIAAFQLPTRSYWGSASSLSLL